MNSPRVPGVCLAEAPRWRWYAVTPRVALSRERARLRARRTSMCVRAPYFLTLVVCVFAQLRNHLQSFLLGGVSAFGFGYYRVQKDVWTAAEAVDSRLAALGEEAVRSQSALLSRVGALEGEIAKLKGAIAAVEEQAKAALEEKK